MNDRHPAAGSAKHEVSLEESNESSDKGEIIGTEMATEGIEDRLPLSGTQERIVTEKRLVNKLDLRLLPTIIIIYIMNHIDRTGITATRLKGMQDDLGINDVQFATVIAILFVTYCPAQIPSNMLLNYITRPSWYIGICVILWGLTSLLTGVTNDFAGILACRIFIGLPEAAFYPGAIYLLSRWYTKKELAVRSAALYGGVLISNAFGNLLAAGILAKMEGILGIRAWRWLFYIEGAITIFVGINSIWILPDYPNNTRWLSNLELRLAQARIAADTGEADKDHAKDSPWAGLKKAIKDPLVGLFAIMNTFQILGLSFNQYFPTLVKTLGYNTTITLLLAASPWVIATVFCCLNAWHADQTGERYFHLVGWWWGVIVAYVIALSTMSIAGRYVALFMMASGFSGFALTLVWVSNSISRPPAKRAAAIAIVNGSGNLGNIVGSYTWTSAWGPQYHPSMVISLGSLVLASLLALTIRQMLVGKNKQLDANSDSLTENHERVYEAARLEGITFEQALERRREFRYLY